MRTVIETRPRRFVKRDYTIAHFDTFTCKCRLYRLHQEAYYKDVIKHTAIVHDSSAPHLKLRFSTNACLWLEPYSLIAVIPPLTKQHRNVCIMNSSMVHIRRVVDCFDGVVIVRRAVNVQRVNTTHSVWGSNVQWVVTVHWESTVHRIGIVKRRVPCIVMHLANHHPGTVLSSTTTRAPCSRQPPLGHRALVNHHSATVLSSTTTRAPCSRQPPPGHRALVNLHPGTVLSSTTTRAPCSRQPPPGHRALVNHHPGTVLSLTDVSPSV